MNKHLTRLIPQARTLITKESFRDQSFGSLEGYVQDIRRPIDLTPLVRVVYLAMSKYPRQSEESDGWLAPRVHASLRLFRSEAADQGIWDYLSVVALRDYVLWRMAGEDGLVNDVNHIVGPFRHQAVARLWWAAELSRNGADYSLTEEAFRSQEAVNYLTDVDAFHNRPAALAYIRFISRIGGGKPIKQRAVETGKTLNHVLTTLVLDSIAPDSGGDLDAYARWIAEAPDARLMDSALPKGPDEPQVPEEKIHAVEQLLERLMEEHRWHEVVVWSERWIAAAQSPEPAGTALAIIPGPGGNESKDAVEKDVVAKDAVLYERFVEALRDDLGVEPSDQTRDLFEKLSMAPDRSHRTEPVKVLSEEATLPKGSQDEKIVDALPTPALDASPETFAPPGNEPFVEQQSDKSVRDVSPIGVSLGSDETSAPSQPLFKDYAESSGMRAAIAESVYRKMLPEQQTIARRIFLRLTEVGEGSSDGTSVDSRRRVTIGELIPHPEDAPAVDAVLKMLADAHLISTDGGTVKVVDEAWIREWHTFQELELANADELKIPERVFLGTSEDLGERGQAEREEQDSKESEAARRFAAAERRFIEAVAVYFGD